MGIWDDDAFHNVLSFALFTICALLVGVLVWVLLRRLRRQREMRDQETMTVEPSVKPASIADSVSGTGASHKESTLQIPGVDAHETTKGHQRSSVGEGPHLADSQAPTTTAAPDTTKSPPPGGAEQIPEAKAEAKAKADAKAEAKAEAKEQSSAFCATSPGDSRQTSVLTSKSKRHHHSHSKKSPESGKAEKEDGKGRKSSAASKTGSKTGSKVGSKAGSKPPSRRSSVQHSQASAGKAGAVDGKGASSKLPASMPAVPALLIRRPSTDSKSSQRSNRSTRYVRETPKVPPPLDIFSREHSSMAESPPSNPIKSPPQACVVATEPAKPPEAPQASSTTEAPEKPPAEATTEGH